MENRNLSDTIGRMLGPAEPEVGCDECFELLDEYVEHEVAGRDADAALPGLRAHLAGCPACFGSAQKEVLGLQIAMDDPDLVPGVHGIDDRQDQLRSRNGQ